MGPDQGPAVGSARFGWRDRRGQPSVCRRRALYRYRAGIPWHDLPQRFGDFKNVHRRFSRWAKSGVLNRVFEHLAEGADNEYAMIDSTIVRAHQHSAGAPKKLPKTRPPAARAAA